VALEGVDHLESVRWKNNRTGQTEEHKIRHVFVMTGANPNTSWLDGCIALDIKGFIKTVVDLGHKSAFDLLLKEAWNPEVAAMGNSTLPTVLDKLNVMA
jgi:alkyl hydroperoxide reductase subunit AhpF